MVTDHGHIVLQLREFAKSRHVPAVTRLGEFDHLKLS
jgi:hypothetical protein